MMGTIKAVNDTDSRRGQKTAASLGPDPANSPPA
jgi:hypothetical protein